MTYNKIADEARILHESEKREKEYHDAKERQKRLAAEKALTPQQEEQVRQRQEAVAQATQEAGRSMRRFF